jgi:hypothetical protein
VYLEVVRLARYDLAAMRGAVSQTDDLAHAGLTRNSPDRRPA